MKQTILVAVSALVLLAVGVIGGRTVFNPKCHRPHINVINDGRFMVIPVDSVEGRPTFNVVFEDETGLDSMYPEEIANSLNTGKWNYNEDLVIKERQ